MEKREKTSADKETKIPETEVKKSKIRLYWEERERLGAKGEIINMRAVLR